MMYMLSLSTRRLFSHLLLEVNFFPVLTENLILRGGTKSEICDITNHLEVRCGNVNTCTENTFNSKIGLLTFETKTIAAVLRILMK